ncbi:hypothetical protein R3P38DRAFT_1644679 [Favolaschia claudopus]|uniref:Uncharacterized protein n=1 Tax=Favolaschia claudopus TaxID=2862362 RepID=A0AAW0DIC8_9AGAR
MPSVVSPLATLWICHALSCLPLITEHAPAAALMSIAGASPEELDEWRWYAGFHYRLMLEIMLEDVCGKLQDSHIITCIRDFLMSPSVVDYLDSLVKLGSIDVFYAAIGSLDIDAPQEWLVELFRPFANAMENYGRTLEYKLYQHIHGQDVGCELSHAFNQHLEHHAQCEKDSRRLTRRGRPVGDSAITLASLKGIFAQQDPPLSR